MTQWMVLRGGFNVFSQSPFGAGLIGSVVGGLFTLFGIGIQSWLEGRKESETEKNKLVYLNFLLEDTYRAVTWYDSSAQRVLRSVEKSPFIIPDFPLYPIHSLDAIVNKINQEEYYLAFVNQTKNKSLTEVLLICNALYKQFSNASDHYKAEFKPLMDEKATYLNMLDSLSESLNQYYIRTGEGKGLIGDEAIIHRGLTSLSDSVKKLYAMRESSFLGYNQMLYDSKRILIVPMVKVLDPRGEVSHRRLLLQAISVGRQHEKYVGRIRNVVGVIERNRMMMNQLTDTVRVVSKPLKDYIDD